MVDKVLELSAQELVSHHSWLSLKKRMDMALGAIWSCWTGVELESLDLET